MRAVIKWENTCAVSVTSDVIDIFSHETVRVTRNFWCPSNGGYIYERDTKTWQNRQVCDGLESLGNTLWIKNPGDLIEVIRREWRKSKRAEERIKKQIF